MIIIEPNDLMNFSINEYSKEHLYENSFMLLDTEFIQQNSFKININDVYKFRPDRLSYKYYGSSTAYPIILAANNIGSIYQFKPELLNNECYIPTIEFVSKYLK